MQPYIIFASLLLLIASSVNASTLNNQGEWMFLVRLLNQSAQLPLMIFIRIFFLRTY
jgi:hypothetical protein